VEKLLTLSQIYVQTNSVRSLRRVQFRNSATQVQVQHRNKTQTRNEPMETGLKSGLGTTRTNKAFTSRPAMSNPNGLLSQKLCHCLNQGRTLNDILTRAVH